MEAGTFLPRTPPARLKLPNLQSPINPSSTPARALAGQATIQQAGACSADPPPLSVLFLYDMLDASMTLVFFVPRGPPPPPLLHI